MVFLTKVELLTSLVDAALRSTEFQATASTLVEVALIREAVEEDLGAKRVPVNIVDVRRPMTAPRGRSSWYGNPPGVASSNASGSASAPRLPLNQPFDKHLAQPSRLEGLRAMLR